MGEPIRKKNKKKQVKPLRALSVYLQSPGGVPQLGQPDHTKLRQPAAEISKFQRSKAAVKAKKGSFKPVKAIKTYVFLLKRFFGYGFSIVCLRFF